MRTIDVTYYGLDLEITTSPDYLTGEVTINASVDDASISTLFLDLQNALTVNAVWLNGAPTTFSHTSHKININLDRTYTQGESFSVQVFYQGFPVQAVLAVLSSHLTVVEYLLSGL